MNLLIRLVSFTAATHKTFSRHIIRGFATATRRRRGDCVTFNTLICEMHNAEELNRAAELLDDQMKPVKKGLSQTNFYTSSLIDSLCKQDRFDDAYRVLNQMILSGFSPSVVTLKNILLGFLRIKNQMGVNYNTLITEMSKAQELSHADELLDHMWHVKELSPNVTNYMSLIHSLCKHDDRIHDAYKVLNQMFLSGFSPSDDTVNNVVRGFLRIGDTKKAYELCKEMDEHSNDRWWMDEDTQLSLLQCVSNEVTYTNLMNAFFDEGKLNYARNLFEKMEGLDKYLEYNEMPHVRPLPIPVMYAVFINGLDDNKASRTTQIKMYLLHLNFYFAWEIPTLAYHRTLLENCSFDEFKSLVEIVRGFCCSGLENAYDTMLKFNYKPDGIVYNLFILIHCEGNNVDQAYNIYKEMVHYGFACHMFTVFALIRKLYRVNELHWLIQNVLRSCNLNDSEILKFLNEFNPKQPYGNALFNVLAQKAKDGLFLKCSYDPPSA